MLQIIPRPFDPDSQGAYADVFRNDESGLVAGLRFCATLLPRTPSWILSHHGELWSDKTADPPNYGNAGDGIWVAALPWQLDNAESPSNGPPEYDQRTKLQFYRRFREIVESESPPAAQVAAITELVQSDPRFIHLAKFYSWDLPRSYFIGRLAELEGNGRGLATRLFDAGFLTPETVLAATAQQLASVNGIGRATLQRVRRSTLRPAIWPPNPDAS